MTSNDMAGILEDLAAGRIDPAEAARRIDAISATHDRSSDSRSDDASDSPSEDAWAASTDRPQAATHTHESFRHDGPAAEATEPTEHTKHTEHTKDAESTGARAAAEAPEAGSSSGSHGSDRPGPTQIRVNRVTSPNGVERVSVRAIGRRVRIIGESSVATVSADGPHVLRRNGSVLEISSDGELGASIDGFQILRGAPRNLDDFRALGLGKELLLKVNPAITVDVEVTAGSLHTERIPRLGKVRVTAGGAKLLDVTQIADALIQAGQATVKGTITGGRSRIRAESGSLAIHLGDDSDVTVSTDAQLGKVSWGGGHTGSGDEVVMGDGRGRLEVEVLMGHATVRVGSEQSSEPAGQAS